MKKFFKTTMLVICVLLVINIVLDYVFTKRLCHSQYHYYKPWNCIIHDTIEADLLVLGSSRALRQYDPYIMDSMLCTNTYVLGQNSFQVNRQIVFYDIYLHYQKKKPSYLIINFDYYGNWEGSRTDRVQYYPYFVNPFMRRLIKKQEQFDKMELNVPMYRYYYQGILSLMRKKNDSVYWNQKNWYKGYWGNPSKWDGKKLMEIEKIKFNPQNSIVEKFDSFLTELQRDGIDIVFVSSPIYVGATEKVENLSDFYDFRKRFSEKYDIPVLDYIYDSISYDTAYFYNATHLNKTGAELFTTKLCHDLDSLGILQP